jgi:hypothetical protein
MTVATRHEVWDALHYATDAYDLPVPRYIKDTECVIADKAPLLVVRLDYLNEARAWADYLDISASAAISHNAPAGLVGINFMGDWMGWRVLLLADEPDAAEALVNALLAPDRGDV